MSFVAEALRDSKPTAPESRSTMGSYWLIEYREDGRTVGYLKDLRRGDGGLDAIMVRSPERALRFADRVSAQTTIDDWAFQRTVPHADRFAVEEHMDCPGPSVSA